MYIILYLTILKQIFTFLLLQLYVSLIFIIWVFIIIASMIIILGVKIIAPELFYGE